ncbi:MAG: DMT family transporter [Armatimonadota bacterium]
MATEIRERGEEESEPSADTPLTWAAVFQVVLLAAGWGGNAPALRFSLDFIPPFAAAGYRFLIGAVVIAAVASVQRVRLWPRKGEWAPLVWMGVLFLVQICLLNAGSARTTAARQALLINSYPLFVPLLAHLFVPGDRLTWQKSAGTLAAFIGVLFILGESAFRSGGGIVGDLLIFASAVLLAGKAVYTSRLVQDAHPYKVLVWQMIIGVPAFFAASLMAGEPGSRWTGLVLTSIVYQGVIVAGLCFIGWTALLKYFSPSRLSVGFFLTPVFGAIFSYLLLGEALTGGLLGGGAAILFGLFMVNRSPTREKA